MPYFKDIKDSIMNRAKQALHGRKVMSTTRKKMKRANENYESEGEGGEYRNMKAKPKSDIGAMQKRNKSMKQQLDQLN